MEVGLLKKALIREKKARKEAESILEKKSLELYNTNEQLKDALENTNLFPEQCCYEVLETHQRFNLYQ
jgi:hypothetical protein